MQNQHLENQASIRSNKKVLVRYKKKKQANIRKIYQRQGNKHAGIWNVKETIQYIQFLKFNSHLFKSEVLRRKSCVFKEMAKNIPSRNSKQCRSHHQKKIKEYETIQHIVEHFQTQVIPYYSLKAQQWEQALNKQREERDCPWSRDHNGLTYRVWLNISEIPSY